MKHRLKKHMASMLVLAVFGALAIGSIDASSLPSSGSNLENSILKSK